MAIELVSAGLSIRGSATSPGDVQLLIRFAGIEKTVDFQIATAAKLLNNSALRDIEIISDDNSIWRNLQVAPLANNLGLSYRIAVQPSQLHRAIETVIEHADGNPVWQAGVADGRIRVMQNERANANSKDLLTLRAAAEAWSGSLIIERAPSEVKSEVDAWGALPATGLMARIKHELDPKGLFSPGRF